MADFIVKCGICYTLIDINKEYEEGDSYFTRDVVDPRWAFVVRSTAYSDRRVVLGVTLNMDKEKNYWISAFTPADINLYKRVRAICRGGLDSRLIDGKAAPVGAIFYAKAKEGYQETQNIIHTYENKGGSVAALPDFGSFAALPDENGGK